MQHMVAVYGRDGGQIVFSAGADDEGSHEQGEMIGLPVLCISHTRN
jgi:hypothetical protein